MRPLVTLMILLFLLQLVTASVNHAHGRNGKFKLVRSNLQASSKKVSVAKSVNVSSMYREELMRERQRARSMAIHRLLKEIHAWMWCIFLSMLVVSGISTKVRQEIMNYMCGEMCATVDEYKEILSDYGLDIKLGCFMGIMTLAGILRAAF